MEAVAELVKVWRITFSGQTFISSATGIHVLLITNLKFQGTRMSYGDRNRVLVIDDNLSIHEDFKKILGQQESEPELSFREIEKQLFEEGEGPSKKFEQAFELDFAPNGEEGINKVQAALEVDEPFSIAFVDMRMGVGMGGIETIKKLWEIDHEIQVVICTAYSDHSWEEISRQVGETDSFLILKKPFELMEVRQIACALASKWHIRRHDSTIMEELEYRVLERTRELEMGRDELVEKNRELSAAREEAECASRAKSEFLQNVSHELRTPMAGIIGCSELLTEVGLKEISESEFREYIHTIKNNAEGLILLIDEILDLSRLEADRLETQSVTINVRNLVGDLVAPLRKQARAKGLSFSVDISDSVPKKFHSDPIRISQIIRNLIDNAIKFTKSGEISLKVYTEDENVFFCVEDSGMGISQEELEVIFEPFAQAYGSTDREFEGTGIGLSLCSRLAHLLKGELSVESVKGKGSRFYFKVPFEEKVVSHSHS